MWAGCVHWFGQICTFKKERPGEIGARGANLPEPVHLSCAPGASAAPVLHSAWQNPATASPPLRHCRHRQLAPAHLLPQYCTLLGKTRHRHRPRTGRRLQTVRPGTSATPDPAAPAPPVRTACPPHPALPVRTACPPHPVLPDHPQTLTPPANSETPRPPNGRRGVNTQRGVSARRLTRQLRKSPRPQRRHLRCRLLARPLRERQRPQEQQR